MARNSTGIFLCQCRYVLDVISKEGLLGAKPVGFPMDSNHHLFLAKDNFILNP